MFGAIRMSRPIVAAFAGLAVLAVAACSGYDGASLPKHLRPLDSKTRALIQRNGMEETAPIFIRIFKEESQLEVWKLQHTTGRYALLMTYEICAWSGVLGPKLREGDRQAPEGFYTIRPAQMNPNSNYHLSFNLGYPNAFDQALGRTGSELMVHGACSSAGCYSMTDENIQEIYTLGRLAFQGGQREFQVQTLPFRMTPENLARHRNDPNMPFWMMLKDGNDHFEVLRVPPKVDVCDRRYVFNAMPEGNARFEPAAACPPMSMPEAVRTAVAQKADQDRTRMLQIAARLDRQDNTSGVDALMLAFAQPATVDLAGPISLMPAVSAPSAPPEPVMTASVLPATPTPSHLTSTAASPVPPAAAPAPEVRIPSPAPRPVDVAAVAPPATASAAPPPTPTLPAPAPVAATTALPAATGIDPFMSATGLGVVDAGIAAPTPASPASPAAAAAAEPDAATLQERMLADSVPQPAGAPPVGSTWGSLLWGWIGR